MTNFHAMPTLSQKGYFAHFPPLVTPIQRRIAATVNAAGSVSP
jgi:hypothetical protein